MCIPYENQYLVGWPLCIYLFITVSIRVSEISEWKPLHLKVQKLKYKIKFVWKWYNSIK